MTIPYDDFLVFFLPIPRPSRLSGILPDPVFAPGGSATRRQDAFQHLPKIGGNRPGQQALQGP